MRSNETATESKVGLERRFVPYGHGQKVLIPKTSLHRQEVPQGQGSREEDNDEGAPRRKAHDGEEGGRKVDDGKEKDVRAAEAPLQVEGSCQTEGGESLISQGNNEEGRVATHDREAPREADCPQSGEEGDAGRGDGRRDGQGRRGERESRRHLDRELISSVAAAGYSRRTV